MYGRLTPNSSNSTLPFGYHDRNFLQVSLKYAIPFSIASGLLSLVGGMTNLFVIALLAKYTQMNQNMDLYIFSLCLSDFFYNVVFQPQVVVRQFAVESATSFEHSFLHGTGTMFLAAGSFSLLSVSFDKYVFIKFPFRYSTHVSKNKTKITIIFVWAISSGLGVLVFFDHTLGYTFYPITIAIIFVFTIIIQILIFVIAKNQHNRIRCLARSLEHNHPSPTLKHRTADRAIIRTKATKTIGLMLVVYVSSWLPSTLYRLHFKLVGGDVVVFHQWAKIFDVMIQLHSCINPFIYIFRTAEVKLAFQNMLRYYRTRHCCCNIFVAPSASSDD